MFPIDRYRFYVDDAVNPSTIYAISTYAGKTVRGVARCDSCDTFSEEKGKELAAARCEEKVARKRMNAAERKYKAALAQQEEINSYVQKVSEYFIGASKGFDEAQTAVQSLLEKM